MHLHQKDKLVSLRWIEVIRFKHQIGGEPDKLVHYKQQNQILEHSKL